MAQNLLKIGNIRIMPLLFCANLPNLLHFWVGITFSPPSSPLLCQFLWICYISALLLHFHLLFSFLCPWLAFLLVSFPTNSKQLDNLEILIDVPQSSLPYTKCSTLLVFLPSLYIYRLWNYADESWYMVIQ